MNEEKKNENVNNEVPVTPQVTNTDSAQPSPATTPINPTPIEQVVQTPIVTSQQKTDNKKRNLIGIVVIFLVIIIFVLALPYITSALKSSDNYHYETGSTVEEVGENLLDGFIQINKLSYMTVNKIKFYDFKTSDNKVSYIAISEENINDISSLNMAVGLYDANKELIYKSDFLVSKLDRSVLVNQDIILDSDTYSRVMYAKITTNTVVSTTSSISCTKETVYGNTKVNEENIFYFTGLYLSSYDVIKSVYSPSKSDENYITQTESLNTLYEDITKSNVNTSTIEKTDEKLLFTIDVSTYNKNESTYELLYTNNHTKTLIKDVQIEKGWTCE